MRCLRSWILITLLMILGTLLCVSSVPDAQKLSPRITKELTKTHQVVEFVLSKECVESIKPGLGFEVRVPVKEDGKPNFEAMHTTGPAIITLYRPIPPGCIVRYDVKRVEDQ